MNQAKVKRVRDLVDGVLLLDKPVGFSSNDALIKAKRVLNAKKAGHTGTLDPFATGLLPLCFGEATKFSQDLLEADKTYETVVHLGQTTDTGDTEGEVIDTRDVNVTLEQIHAVLAQFRGPIAQVPLLGLVMFGMGLTLKLDDFAEVARHPWRVALGVVAHFVIMPGSGTM